MKSWKLGTSSVAPSHHLPSSTKADEFSNHPPQRRNRVSEACLVSRSQLHAKLVSSIQLEERRIGSVVIMFYRLYLLYDKTLEPGNYLL